MGGCAFIINDEIDRPGSKADVTRLTATLESIGCEVYDWSQEVRTKEDLSRKADELTSEKKRDFFKEKDYVIMIYMSHASNDGRAVLSSEVDAQPPPSKKIAVLPIVESKYFYLRRQILNPLFEIEELDGKLKWVLTQTCRGVQKTKDAQRDVPTQKYWRNYYLMSWATSEDSPAARTDEGSPYITQLCDQLKIKGRGLRAILESTATAIRQDPDLRQTPGYEFHFPEDSDFSFTNGFYKVDA